MLRQLFWADIDTIEDARGACRRAAGTAFFIAIATAVVIFLTMSGKIKIVQVSPEALVDAGIFFLLGIGLLFNSRIAAILVTLVYALNQYLMISSGMVKVSGLAIVFVFLFINGIRGAFAYHAFKKLFDEEPGPVTPVSLRPQEPVAQTSSSDRPKSKAGIFILIALLTLAGIGAAAFFLIRPKKNGGGFFQKSAEQLQNAVTVHLGGGKELRGVIRIEDPDFILLETVTGREEVIQRSDIRNIEKA